MTKPIPSLRFMLMMFGDDGDPLDVLFHPPRTSLLHLFFTAPFKTLAKPLHAYRSSYLSKKVADAVTILCISDTHNKHPEAPQGDLLVSAGHLLQGGTRQEIQPPRDWLKDLSRHKKVVIAGNYALVLDLEKQLPDDERRSLDWYDLMGYEGNHKAIIIR